MNIVDRWQDARSHELRGHVVAVIDVLRWSTVVVTAIAHGATSVEAFANPAAARARAAALGRDLVLLGGERGNLPLDGFDVGNSPGEYTEERVRGRIVITTTTNGTRALLVAAEAREVVVAALVNLDAVARRLGAAREAGHPVTILCAGQAGEVADEDLACADAIVHALNGTESQGAAADRVRGASHAAALRAAGFGADVEAAARVSVYGTIPVTTGDAPLRDAAASGQDWTPAN